MKKHMILALVVACSVGAFTISGDTGVREPSASAAPYYHHWANVYSLENGHTGGPYRGDSPARVRETADGGFAIGLTKWQDSASNGYDEMGIIMLGPSGQPKWGSSPLATTGDDGECYVQGFAVLSDGRIAVAAHFMNSSDDPYFLIALTMLGRDGAVQWIKTFRCHDVYDLEPTKDGGMLLAGRQLLGQGPWAARLNSTGRIVWQARLDATIRSIQQTPDGGFIGVGDSGNESDQPTTDAWIAKFNALGKITWQRSLGDPAAADGFYRVLVMGDGYLAAGVTTGLGASVQDIWVVKFDFQGHIRWQRAYGRRETGFSNGLAAIVRLHEGGYLLCGGNGFALKLDPSGNILWGMKSTAWITDAIQTRQGDFVLLGGESGPADCFPVGDNMSSYLVAVRFDTMGTIGTGCCAIGLADAVSRKTVAIPYDTHFSTYHSPAAVGSLSPTDPGLVPVTVYNVCLADLK